jgi:hypothetical protein
MKKIESVVNDIIRKEAGKPDFAFPNSVLGYFLVYLIYSDVYVLNGFVIPVGVESTMESTDGYEDSDWLHRSNSYKPLQIDKDNTCTVLVFFLILIIFSCVCMMPRPRLISCYYMYVDEYSDRCIDQSGMIDLIDASPDLNLGTLFFH